MNADNHDESESSNLDDLINSEVIISVNDTTTDNSDNTNINQQLTVNSQTTIRIPQYKQPFSTDELNILQIAVANFRNQHPKNKSLKWNLITYLYINEATNQYALDNTKQIFSRTKTQLEERYKKK